jgi:chromosome segregation ATPase
MDRKQEIIRQIEQLKQQIESGVSMHAAEMCRQQIAALETELEKVEQVDAQKQLEEKHENRVQESQTQIANILDNLEVGGLTMRQMCASEDDYQVLRIRFQKLYEQQADNFSKQIKGYEERELQLTRQNENLQDRINEVEEQSAKLAETISKLENERDDAEAKRDAAAREIESVKGEVQQLKSWNDDLRNQIALGVGGAIKVIDPEEKARQDAEEKERIERIKAQRTVYDLQPVEPINPKNYKAKRALDGETVTINWTQLRSYIVLEDEAEVSQFRLKHAPAVVPDISLVTPALPIVENQFQNEGNQPIGLPVSEDGSSGGVEESPVTRAEFEELKCEVERIKQLNGMVA